MKRGHHQCYPLNDADIKHAYRVRDKVISDLSVAPNLKDLAQFAGMSESKLECLFKKIFGDSIYNYYQTMRMREAAYLIKEKNLSVSDAGYRVGFTNLCHFSRLFERYLGVKPKKYSGGRRAYRTIIKDLHPWGKLLKLRARLNACSLCIGFFVLFEYEHR